MFRNFEMMGYHGFGMWFIPVMAWSLFWKGVALWKSAKNDEKYWFVALLVINTMGLLELSYLFIFAKNKLVLGTSPAPKKPTKTKK